MISVVTGTDCIGRCKFVFVDPTEISTLESTLSVFVFLISNVHFYYTIRAFKASYFIINETKSPLNGMLIKT